MQIERNKIEAEKAENAKMLEELRALKAQLECQQPTAVVDKASSKTEVKTTEVSN